ncbi:MAG: hypothetical protein M3P51_16100 [Chloroflexota bacterium]|nr:hypothetical protein [Chloroflexota bacterium]
MADESRIGLQELLRKAQIEGDAEFLKQGVGVISFGGVLVTLVELRGALLPLDGLNLAAHCLSL